MYVIKKIFNTKTAGPVTMLSLLLSIRPC